MKGLFACTLLLSLVAVTSAFAAPKDCSIGAIPDTPVKGVVAGKPFNPNAFNVQITRNGMRVDAVKMDRYALYIQTNGIFNELSVDAVLRQGAALQGHVFRMIPKDDIAAQPAATTGVPEIQGWDLELEAANVDTSFTQDTASLRLEYGARKGDVIPGKIHFCSESTGTEITGTFNAKVGE
ncbi:MAG TPA: hypothetical protein VLT91_08605 [Rhizomicrobium sp.]|nr:hypothetical protein [Rhizomicrobium sp.]